MSAENEYNMRVIARIETDFFDKFGIPRQSGLVGALEGRIVFEPEYRSPEAIRGIEGFSHLWLVWCFSQTIRQSWSPTVRPPRLGGNTRMGVFATRSPFRPNPIALSSVRLERVEEDAALGPTLIVSGADMMNGTPIFDIKPYVPLYDSHPDAQSGFTQTYSGYGLSVSIPEGLLPLIPPEKLEALRGVLANDPRPSYQNDAERVYGMRFAGMEVRFTVDENLLTVRSIERVE